MMKTKNKTKNKMKRPLSITLIIVWMVWGVIRNSAKMFNIERFELSKQVLGNGMAISNYVMDIIILIALVILIIMFISRKRNSWKYFIYLMIILMIGVLIGLPYVNETASLISQGDAKLEGFMSIFTYIGLFIAGLFYAFLAYVVYKKRSYFKK